MGESQLPPAQTVVALFDDQIDAERALAALRKSAKAATNVSVLARDRRGAESSDSPLDVTRAVMDTAMTAMGSWLTGLVALMVPNQGHFLAAGPIGVVLSRIRPESDQGMSNASLDRSISEPVGSVGLALERFGFRQNEAHYLEQRVAAGSAMIAVTATTREQVDSTLKAFAAYDAVFIGQAETPGDVVSEAQEGLLNPLTASDTEIVVADVVAPLRHTSGEHEITGIAAGMSGVEVIDLSGERIGNVDDVLVDPVDDHTIRYVVVGSGGLLGIARRRIAIPCEVVHCDETPVRLRRDRAALHDAPGFDAGEPFSRRDEELIHRFYGTKPYWLD